MSDVSDTTKPMTIRCPQCGHLVPDFFHHVAIECESDMTEQQIEQLMQLAEFNVE